MLVQIRPANCSAYMRHTYENDQVKRPQGAHVQANEEFNTGTPSTSRYRNPITPETFVFSSPTDFGAYLREKYPHLVSQQHISTFL